jgi:hypothetical protein
VPVWKANRSQGACSCELKGRGLHTFIGVSPSRPFPGISASQAKS